jgi:hypothetical protein
MDAGATLSRGMDRRRSLWKVAQELEEILTPPIRFRNESPVFKVALQAHSDTLEDNIRIYAAINGESTANIRIPGIAFRMDKQQAADEVQAAMAAIENALDHHQDQIIERAFSQASAGFFFRG